MVANSGKSFPMLMETFPILAKVPNVIAPWKKGLGGRARGPDLFYNLAKEANESKSDSFSRTIFNLKPKFLKILGFKAIYGTQSSCCI